jgi:hypothetical protein
MLTIYNPDIRGSYLINDVYSVGIVVNPFAGADNKCIYLGLDGSCCGDPNDRKSNIVRWCFQGKQGYRSRDCLWPTIL